MQPSKQAYKIDLHSHSVMSHDGIMVESDYKKLFDSGKLDYLAITDHNEIEYAQKMQKVFGERIIVGEEISVTLADTIQAYEVESISDQIQDWELRHHDAKINRMAQNGRLYDLIGLFLTKKIEKGTPIRKAIRQIHEQGGLVYIPHPGDPMRGGIPFPILELPEIYTEVDMYEEFNARYIWPFGNRRVAKFVSYFGGYPLVAGSDAHAPSELGRTYNVIYEKPNADNLSDLLIDAEDDPRNQRHYVHPWQYLNPKINKVRKAIMKDMPSPTEH